MEYSVIPFSLAFFLSLTVIVSYVGGMCAVAWFCVNAKASICSSCQRSSRYTASLCKDSAAVNDKGVLMLSMHWKLRMYSSR